MFPEADWQELVAAVAEMVLQMRIDVRKETHDWFSSLFGKDSVETTMNFIESFRLKDVIRRPMHSIRTKIAQQRGTFDVVPIGLNFSLIEKRTGREMAYERWHFTFSHQQALGSQTVRLQQIFLLLAYLHEVLIKLPLWTEFLKRDSGTLLKRSAHFINYEVAMGPMAPRQFSLQSAIHNTTIIERTGKVELRVRYSQLDGLLVTSQTLSYSNGLRLLLSSSKKSLLKKQSTEDSEKSKDNTLSGASLLRCKTRTTSLKLPRRLSAFHFDDQEHEVTFLSTAEEPQIKLTEHLHSKEQIILEDKKSSSEFEVLQNEHEEAYDYFRQELERLKLSLSHNSEL